MGRKGDCGFEASVDMVNASVALLLLPATDMLNVCGTGSFANCERLDPENATIRCSGRKLHLSGG